METEQKLKGVSRLDAPVLNAEWLGQNVEGVAGAIRPEYFKSKRWFGSKLREIKAQKLLDFALLQSDPALMLWLLVEISYTEGEAERYHTPLVFCQAGALPDHLRQQEQPVALVVQTAGGEYWAYDGLADDDFSTALYQRIYDGTDLLSQAGVVHFEAVPGRMAEREVHSIKRISGEQSNTSLIFNEKLILKGFRKLLAGQNPDFEVPFFLTTQAGFRYVPAVAGYIEYQPGGGEAAQVGVIAEFKPNSGNGRAYTLEQLRDYFRQVEQVQAGLSGQERKRQAAEFARPYAAAARRLGQITGEMHNALASRGDVLAFAPEPITEEDVKGWQGQIAGLIEQVTNSIKTQGDRQPAGLRDQLQKVVDHKGEYLKLIGQLTALSETGVCKIRYHGDYHLEQVLKTGDDFIILDFEGEPLRSLAERRAKQCPLKDIAGMLRSFDYAAYSGLFEAQARLAERLSFEELEGWTVAWEQVARPAFLEGYFEVTGQEACFLPRSQAVLEQAISVFELEKAFYELNYEFNNRPTWVPIPVNGLLRIIGEA